MDRIEIEPEAKQVLDMVCDIQLSAIESIKDYPNKSRELAAKLIQLHFLMNTNYLYAPTSCLGWKLFGW